ncbi:MAG: hypothetical protein K6C08_16130 [Oscillospiraceae bacterium]|nr:hypothetical protein [Oscillospiraceae bacterium]
MAQFDPSTIEGFEGMTAEQKVEALLSAEIPEDVDLSKFISKDQFDKKVSELNGQNKKLKDQMNAEQQKKVEEDEAKQQEAQKFADLESKYQELLKASTLKEHTISLTGLGFEEKLAGDTAAAIADGDAAKLFKNMKTFLDGFRKSVEKELMDRTPGIGGSGGKSSEETDRAVELAKGLVSSGKKTGEGYSGVMKNYILGGR